MFDERDERAENECAGEYPSTNDLKESRARILSATSRDILGQEISLLEAELSLMSGMTSGEVKSLVDRAIKEIWDFKMHDKTRADVARCVQSIICQINLQ